MTHTRNTIIAKWPFCAVDMGVWIHSMVRGFTCWVMILLFPASLVAADSGGAMLYGKGVVSVNGSAIPGSTTGSTAIFPGDLIETKADSVASINLPGSSVNILPGSLVRFEGDAVRLEHGSISVASSRQFKALIRCITVIPYFEVATQYEVTDVDGNIHIAARKSDVDINRSDKTALLKTGVPTAAASKEASKRKPTLLEGQETTREERSCKGGAARPAGDGSLANAKYLGIAPLVGLGIWLLLPDENSSSDTDPQNNATIPRH